MRRISVALCVDDENGMMFRGRRQSRDRVLIADFMRDHEGETVCISPYSKLLFGDFPQVTVCDSHLECCPNGGACFVEASSLAEWADVIGCITVYRWNRLYPADLYFEADILKKGFSLISTTEFEGSSHEKITKEVYQK